MTPRQALDRIKQLCDEHDASANAYGWVYTSSIRHILANVDKQKNT